MHLPVGIEQAAEFLRLGRTAGLRLILRDDVCHVTGRVRMVTVVEPRPLEIHFAGGDGTHYPAGKCRREVIQA